MHYVIASAWRSLRSATKAAVVLLMLAGTSSVLQAAERLYIFTEHYPPYNASVSGEGFAHNEEGITGICTDMVKAALAPIKWTLFAAPDSDITLASLDDVDEIIAGYQ